jgi:hypothetical protein
MRVGSQGLPKALEWSANFAAQSSTKPENAEGAAIPQGPGGVMPLWRSPLAGRTVSVFGLFCFRRRLASKMLTKG